MGEALLRVERLRVRFRVLGALQALTRSEEDPWIDAVLDVSFGMRTGETLALVGESGSGKTTLGRAIIGLVRAQEGSIRFEGAELRGMGDRAYKPYRRDIAMMFQDPVASLSPRRTVRGQIREPFHVHRTGERDPEAEVGRLMDLVGLPHNFADRFPHELSGGQARRVGVARALALSPKLIIADEPTAGLDVSVQGEVLNLMSGLQSPLRHELPDHHPQPSGGAPHQRPGRHHVPRAFRGAGDHRGDLPLPGPSLHRGAARGGPAAGPETAPQDRLHRRGGAEPADAPLGLRVSIPAAPTRGSAAGVRRPATPSSAPDTRCAATSPWGGSGAAALVDRSILPGIGPASRATSAGPAACARAGPLSGI